MDKNENINSINNTKNKNNNNNMVILEGDPSTKPSTNPASPGPVGQEEGEGSLEGCREAEGVEGNLAPKPNLADERIALIQSGNWINPSDIDYLKIDIWPQPNSQGKYTDYKVMYAFKTKNNYDLRSNKFASKLTRRHNDYYSYLADKWDNVDVWPVYRNVMEAVKQYNKGGGEAHAGRAAANTGVRKNPKKRPILPYTTVLLYEDHQDDDWICDIWHHDFHVAKTVPRWQWREEYDKWIKEFGIKKEFNKKVPPMITMEWRSVV